MLTLLFALTALPVNNTIELEWDKSSRVAQRTMSVERWTDGGVPTTIATLSDASKYVDTKADVNRIYYYRISRGANTSNTATAVISDTTKPFICPRMQPVPAANLGVDRTISFTGANGTEVSFTVKVPVPKPLVISVPPCGSVDGCSDYLNIKNAISQVTAAGGGTVQLDAGNYYLRPPPDTPEWLSAISITYTNDFTLAGAAGSDGAPLTHVYSNPAPGKLLHTIAINTVNRILVKNLTLDVASAFGIPGIITDSAPNKQVFTVTDEPAYYIPDPAIPPKMAIFVGYDFTKRNFIRHNRSRAGVLATFNQNFAQDGKYTYSWSGQWFPNGMTAVGIVPTGAALRAANVNDFSVENVHIYGAGGPGIVVSDAGKGARLSNVKITPKPDALRQPGEKPRFLSIWGDSDSNNHHGGLLIENSEFAMVEDDFWNFKGPSRQLTAVFSTYGARFGGGYTPTSVRVGNEMSFIDPLTLAPIGKPASITSYALEAGVNTVHFTEVPELEAYIGRPSIELPIYTMPKYSSPKFVIRDSCFRDSAGGRILAQSSDGLIEGNVIANTGSPGIDLAGYPVHWNEGPGANNIIVRNNKLIGTGVGYYQDLDARTGDPSGGSSGLLGAQLMLHATAAGGFYADSSPLRDIDIVDNFFANSLGLAILVSSARGVNVQNNVIVNANAVPFYSGFNAKYCGENAKGFASNGVGQPWCMAKIAARGSIMATHSHAVDIFDNEFLGTSHGVFVR